MFDERCSLFKWKGSSLIPTLRSENLGKVGTRTLFFVYAGVNCEATTLMLHVIDRWLAELILALRPHPHLLSTTKHESCFQQLWLHHLKCTWDVLYKAMKRCQLNILLPNIVPFQSFPITVIEKQ